jgi:molecular chaperone DnaK (HSP70)
MKLGIDFGTTNTVISYFENNKIKLLEIDNKFLIPSKILINKENIICGHLIKNIKKESLLIENFKIEIPNNKKYIFNNNIYSTNDLIFYYFNYLSELIKNKFKKDNYDCVISVPSNFNSSNRKIIKTILQKFNFNILRIINEPTAAALYYEIHLNNKIENKILVIDIGGGTTDLTILDKDEELYEVIQSLGDNNLGGKNITENIFNYVKDLDVNIKLNDCKLAKENLKNYEIKINNIKLDNHIFNEININTLKRLENYLNKLNKIYIKEINEIILVGGSIKLELFQTLIKKTFNQKKIIILDECQSIVSKGSCSYCNYLTSKNEIIIMELVQNSIGIETADKNFSIIIPSGLPLPVKKTKKYRITENDDEDDKFDLKIYQGENELANDNQLLKIIDLRKINAENIIISIILTIDNILKIKINDDFIKDEIQVNNNLIKKKEVQHNFNFKKNLFLVQEKLNNLIKEFEKNSLINIDKKKNILKFLHKKLIEIKDYDLNKLLELQNYLQTNFI